MGPVPAGGAGPRRNRAHERLLLGRVVGRTAETPDLLDMALDKASYRSGERMDLRLSPRFAGKATLAVVGDGSTRSAPWISPPRGRMSACPSRGCRRLCGGARTPPLDQAAPPAGTRARGCMVRRRSRRPRAAGGACGACADTPAGNPEAADPNRRLERRRAGSSHGGRRRCRHPEPDPLSCARSGRVFLRPAAALHRNPRPLRLSHRRDAGHPRLHPFGRRHGRRDRRLAADPGARVIPASSRSHPTARRRSNSTSRPSTARPA